MRFPAVFFKADSVAGLALRDYVIEQGYTEGFECN